MPFWFFVWNDAIEDYIGQHDITPDEFETVVMDPDKIEASRSSDRLIAFGSTDTGRYIAAVFEFIDESTVLPVTAYEIED